MVLFESFQYLIFLISQALANSWIEQLFLDGGVGGKRGDDLGDDGGLCLQGAFAELFVPGKLGFDRLMVGLQ